MADRNQQDNRNAKQDDITGKGHERPAVDKATGKEMEQNLQNVAQETQKGKNKVDGDPSKPGDQPIDQSRH